MDVFGWGALPGAKTAPKSGEKDSFEVNQCEIRQM
jgi:hypothetical protein